MYLDVYIGELNDGYCIWDGGSWGGNAPYRQSEFFPDGHRVFWRLLEKIDKGEFEGKQVDWGGWVAKVNKDQIREFIRENYQEGWTTLPHLLEQLNKVNEFVERLDPGKRYALAATEL